jgi:hypothetical protein
LSTRVRPDAVDRRGNIRVSYFLECL